MDQKSLLLHDVSRYYYVENLTQAEIARRLGLSRPKVSRLLADAREQGVVKVFIADVDDNKERLEEKLMSIFAVRSVRVVPVPPTDPALAFQITCRDAGKHIAGLMEEEDRIGLGWGGTLFEISRNMSYRPLPKSRVLQLFGNLDTGEADDYANDIVSEFARRLDAESSHIIPCPVIVGNQIILDMLMHDEKVAESIRMAKNCNKMILNIGLPNRDNCLYKGKYINETDLEHLNSKGAVGCIGCRFYNDNGEICDDQLNNRTVGVSMDDMRNADSVIACVVGEHKTQALVAALKAGLIDDLIVDSNTAMHAIQFAEEPRAPDSPL